MTYNEYIQNILSSRGRFACGKEYHERHHIVPRSIGGCDDDENLIDLYAREHYEAHKLLYEENPNNEAIAFAWWMMSTKNDKTAGRYELTADEYELAKAALSIAQSKVKKELFANKENHPMFGRTQSEDSKEKMRKAKRGKPSPKKGISVSDEEKARLNSIRPDKWSPERHQRQDGMYANGKSVCCVPVYCPELDESFWGLQEVCDKYGFTKPNISKCLKGIRKHSGRHPVTGEKLTWRYLENN